MKKTRLTALVALTALTCASLAVAQDANSPSEPQKVRAVLITGTSSGIGLRMTEVLSKNGFFVYAGARKPKDLKRLDAMPNVKSVRLDVTIQSEIDAAVELVKAEGRGLYGLINNAGVSVMGPLIETPEEDMDFLLDVNLLGPYRVTKAFADLIIESKGRIMNVTSIAGIVSGPFGGVYSMSKHGLEAYTDILPVALAGFDVEVAAVEPGNYKSQIVASMVKRMKAKGYSAENSRYGSMLDLITGGGEVARGEFRCQLTFLTRRPAFRFRNSIREATRTRVENSRMSWQTARLETDQSEDLLHRDLTAKPVKVNAWQVSLCSQRPFRSLLYIGYGA